MTAEVSKQNIGQAKRRESSGGVVEGLRPCFEGADLVANAVRRRMEEVIVDDTQSFVLNAFVVEPFSGIA